MNTIEEKIWERQRVSSVDEAKGERLSDANHIFNFKDRLLEIYGMEEEVKGNPNYKKGFGMEHSITAWEDDRMDRNENGNALDLIVHSNGSEVVWEPYIEFLLRKRILQMSKIDNYDFGYIDGKKSHLGPFPSTGFVSGMNYPWYSLWIEINRGDGNKRN